MHISFYSMSIYIAGINFFSSYLFSNFDASDPAPRKGIPAHPHFNMTSTTIRNTMPFAGSRLKTCCGKLQGCACRRSTRDNINSPNHFSSNFSLSSDIKTFYTFIFALHLLSLLLAFCFKILKRFLTYSFYDIEDYQLFSPGALRP